MKITAAFILSLFCIQLYACNTNKNNELINNSSNISKKDTMKVKITVDKNTFTATLSNNETATAFKAMLPMTINMVELNGNEKYFDLFGKLPTKASNPKAIQIGDLMLYGSNTLVLFYKHFSTSYSYTRLGRIDNPLGLAAALGCGSVTITFEVEK